MRPWLRAVIVPFALRASGALVAEVIVSALVEAITGTEREHTA